MNIILAILAICSIVSGLCCICLSALTKQKKDFNIIIAIFYYISLSFIGCCGIIALIDLIIKIFS